MLSLRTQLTAVVLAGGSVSPPGTKTLKTAEFRVAGTGNKHLQTESSGVIPRGDPQGSRVCVIWLRVVFTPPAEQHVDPRDAVSIPALKSRLKQAVPLFCESSCLWVIGVRGPAH